MKNMFVDAMDRTDIPAIPDGYTVSVAYICVLDIVRSLNSIFNEELFSALASESEDETEDMHSQLQPNKRVLFPHVEAEKRRMLYELIASSWLGMMPALCLYLEASSDQPVVDSILRSFQVNRLCRVSMAITNCYL